MNSLIRNVKTINLPTIKLLSRKVTPSLSTIENPRPTTSNHESELMCLRSRSLPPSLGFFNAALDQFHLADFRPEILLFHESKFQRGKYSHPNNRPTLKVIGKFRRHFSHRSFGRAKNKPQERQVDKNKTREFRDRLYTVPCTKPESGTSKKKFEATSVRSIHLFRTASAPQTTASRYKQRLHKQLTFKDMYKKSPIKALISLNEEVKIKKHENSIAASQARNKAKFHYLTENTECKQCISKNKKRISEFYQRNQKQMNQFQQNSRQFSTYTAEPVMARRNNNKYWTDGMQDTDKEVVLVKDQNLNSSLQSQTVTLFSLIKLQSSRPRPFIPTNSYKFEAKQISEEYRFLPEDPVPDPYPLEMFNDDYTTDFETAKNAQSCPDFGTSMSPRSDMMLSDEPYLNDQNQNPINKVQITHKKTKHHCRTKKQNPIVPGGLELEPRTDLVCEKTDIRNTAKDSIMEFLKKKCPDCGTGKKRAPCKIPLPKPKEEDPCAPPKKKQKPCHKDNPCTPNQLSSTTAQQNTLLYTATERGNVLELPKRICSDSGTRKRRMPCPSELATKEEDPCELTKDKGEHCHKDNKNLASRLMPEHNMEYPAPILAKGKIPSNTKDNEDISVPIKNPYKLGFKLASPARKCSLHKSKPLNKPMDTSKLLEVFKARQKRYKDIIQMNHYQEKPDKKNLYFVHPKDSLNQDIFDGISEGPKVELGEQTKQMLTTAIKKMIEPIIEKEFLKYEEVKAALERMEKHLALTLSTLKPVKSAASLEPSHRSNMVLKYPWQRIEGPAVAEKNTYPEMIDPRKLSVEHRDPIRRISVSTPTRKWKESHEEPYKNNIDVMAKKNGIPSRNSYLKKKRNSTTSGEDPCQKADHMFKKSKKTDTFASLMKKQEKHRDSCSEEDPCKKDDLCKAKDPCEKDNTFNEETNLSKNTCDPCTKPETICKVDPCNNPYCKMEEPPCEPACRSSVGKLEGRSVKCTKSPVQDSYQPCKPKATCDKLEQSFLRKDLACSKCPNHPRLKAWPPKASSSTPQPECFPRKPDCDVKCPEVQPVQCLQSPCKINEAPTEPLKESTECGTKKVATPCISKEKDHGFIEMKRLAKCDVTKNDSCRERPEKFIDVTRSSHLVPSCNQKEKRTVEPKQDQENCVQKTVCEKDDRYCDPDILKKQEEAKRILERMEEIVRKEKEAICKKPIQFKEETRNKWTAVNIEPEKTDDKNVLKKPKKCATKSEIKTKASEVPKRCKSNCSANLNVVTTKERTMVESCSDKITDLCMMIIRKHKGGQKTAPIVVTLSRSQPMTGNFGGSSGMAAASDGGENEDGGRNRKPDCSPLSFLKGSINANDRSRGPFGWTLQGNNQGKKEMFLETKDCKSSRSKTTNSKRGSDACDKSKSEPSISAKKTQESCKEHQNVNEKCNNHESKTGSGHPGNKSMGSLKQCGEEAGNDGKPLVECYRSCKDMENKRASNPKLLKTKVNTESTNKCKKNEEPSKKESDCNSERTKTKGFENCIKTLQSKNVIADLSAKLDNKCKAKEDPCKNKEQNKKHEEANKKPSDCQTGISDTDPKLKQLSECLKRLKLKDNIPEHTTNTCKKTEKHDPCKNKCEDPCKAPQREDPCQKKENISHNDAQKKCDLTQKKSADGINKNAELKADVKKSCGKLLNESPSAKKDDPCKQKEDPCKKKEDPCKKENDPCKKKEDPCKKREDPCKQKEDPCKKKEGDPCKKKDDPCKKKEDPCKKREDPCKKKEDPCRKKEDPCKKKENARKKKVDPCKNHEPCKKKEYPCKKREDPCKKKEDPCKKKADPPKKKEDPCKRKDLPKPEPCIPCKFEDYSKKNPPKDPCKKKDDATKNKQDPCKKIQSHAKPKPNPCNKNVGKASEKKDPCKTNNDGASKVKKGTSRFADCKPVLCEKPSGTATCDDAMNKPMKTISRTSKKTNFKDKYPWNLLKKAKECILTSFSRHDSQPEKSKSVPHLSTKGSQSACNKTNSDPCVNFRPKEEECKVREKLLQKFKDELANTSCKQSEDPCRNKKDEDPCKKEKDSCKKEDDPCKKKEDPCKKTEDPCKKKEDPCKKTADPCKKNEDPCKEKTSHFKKQCFQVQESFTPQAPTSAGYFKDVAVSLDKSVSYYDGFKKTSLLFGIFNQEFLIRNLRQNTTKIDFHTVVNVRKSNCGKFGLTKSDSTIADDTGDVCERLNDQKEAGAKSACNLFPNRRKVDSSVGIIQYCQQKFTDSKQEPCPGECPENAGMKRLSYFGPKACEEGCNKTNNEKCSEDDKSIEKKPPGEPCSDQISSTDDAPILNNTHSKCIDQVSSLPESCGTLNENLKEQNEDHAIKEAECSNSSADLVREISERMAKRAQEYCKHCVKKREEPCEETEPRAEDACQKEATVNNCEPETCLNKSKKTSGCGKILKLKQDKCKQSNDDYKCAKKVDQCNKKTGSFLKQCLKECNQNQFSKPSKNQCEETKDDKYKELENKKNASFKSEDNKICSGGQRENACSHSADATCNKDQNTNEEKSPKEYLQLKCKTTDTEQPNLRDKNQSKKNISECDRVKNKPDTLCKKDEKKEVAPLPEQCQKSCPDKEIIETTCKKGDVKTQIKPECNRPKLQIRYKVKDKKKTNPCKMMRVQKDQNLNSENSAKKCGRTPSRCVDKEIPVRDQSVQKGLKDLTAVGHEKTTLKDMSLLRQCMFMVKDRRHPITQPVNEGELERAMRDGKQVICKVKKLGVGEKLICEDINVNLDECQDEVNFDEDGVERILKCAIVTDRENREKFVCTELLPKNLSKESDEETLRKKDACNKIKVISNKLVCRRCPAGSDKGEIVCSMATVEEIKTPGDPLTKKCQKKKKKQIVLSYNDLMKKCRERETKKEKEQCPKKEKEHEKEEKCC